MNFATLIIFFPTEFETKDPLRRAQLLLFLAPDILYQFSFLILAWIFIKSSVEGHINLAADFYIPTMREKKIGVWILIVLIVLYILMEGTWISLFIIEKLEFETL